tara:strand:- start:5222 stop:5782 length:561 start_codon:yes stop_codon:yes gene_type:complete
MASILKVNTIQDATNSNTALTVSSTGVISEPNRPCFHVTKSADQTVSDATLTLVTFDEVTDGGNSKRLINVGGGFASNKYTVTEQTKGIYFFYLNLCFSCSDVYYDAYVLWRKNGNTDIQLVQATFPATSGVQGGTFHNNVLINLDTSGDYVELYAYADVASGGTMNLNQNAVTQPRTDMGGFKIA